MKRLLDLCLVAMALVVLALPIICVSIAVRITSKNGAVFLVG